MDSHTRLDVMSFSLLINNLMSNGGGNSMNNILQRSLNDTGDYTKPTSKSFIDKLEIHIITDDEEKMNTMCSICQDTMKTGNKSYKLPCPDNSHYFCIGDNPDECDGLLPWLKENNTCPICRYELPLEKDKEMPLSPEPEPPSNTIPDNTGGTIQEPVNSHLQIQITEPIYEEEDYDDNEEIVGENVGSLIEDSMLGTLESALSRHRRQVIGHRISRRTVSMRQILNNLYNLPPPPPPPPTESEHIISTYMLYQPLILRNIPSYGHTYDDDNDNSEDDDGFSDYDMESAILRSIQETSHAICEDNEDNVNNIVKETINDIIDNIVRIS